MTRRSDDKTSGRVAKLYDAMRHVMVFKATARRGGKGNAMKSEG
jgi:hypothetical protein